MKYYNILTALLFVFYSCKNSGQFQKNVIKPNTYSVKEIDSLYGAPKDIASYLITEQHDEFRTFLTITMNRVCF